MIGLRIGGEFRSDYADRQKALARRAMLAAANRCINGPLEDRPGRKAGIVHGEVVPGTGKCQRCNEVAARTRAART